MKGKNIRIPKPLAAIFLATVLLFSGIPTAYAADFSAGTAEELTTALSNAVNGDTIRLTANINYNNQIAIMNKTITLDVQGFTLTVTSASGSGLYVQNGGVTLTGSGAFNVIGYDNGASANNGYATVTSATATRADSGTGAEVSSAGYIEVLGDVTGYMGVYASGLGSGVDIGGDVHANGSGNHNGVYALAGAEVNIYGSVDSSLTGNAAYAFNSGSYIYVADNVTAPASSRGIYANTGGRIVVDGDVQALGWGVWANDGTVTISGNVTATAGNSIGAVASNGGQIIVNDAITANTYVQVNSVNKGISDRTVPTTKLGYATYNEGTDTVWVLASNFDFLANPETLTCEGGDSVVTLTGVDLPAGLIMTAFDGATPTAITGTASGSDTEQTVTLSFPANASTAADKVYTIRVSRDGGTTFEQGISATVTVEKDSIPIEIPTPPTVVTDAVSGITSSGAVLYGNVTSEGAGGMEVTERGFVYGGNADPAIGNAGVVNVEATLGDGAGAFNAVISGLTAGTTYHVRAYAINSLGTSYGGDVSFATLASIPHAAHADDDPPSVVTVEVSDMTISGATVSGNVTSSNGAAVTERGFAYGTSAHPVIGGAGVTRVAAGSGRGEFTAILTGLMPGVTYYVRAYASTAKVTGYGARSALRGGCLRTDRHTQNRRRQFSLVLVAAVGQSAVGIVMLAAGRVRRREKRAHKR